MVVKLVKNNSKSLLLAIGDGANDSLAQNGKLQE